MMKPQKMIKMFFLFLFLFLIGGCTNINNPQRIDGIVDAVYTNYGLNKDINLVQSYLKTKVDNKEISEFTSMVIKKCLERSSK